MITRFMQVMFSAAENNDEELTKQVADDIENAKTQEAGEGVEDDEARTKFKNFLSLWGVYRENSKVIFNAFFLYW